MEEDEQTVSPDVEGLYTNEPLEEVIEIALRELYSCDDVPESPRSEMKSF